MHSADRPGTFARSRDVEPLVRDANEDRRARDQAPATNRGARNTTSPAELELEQRFRCSERLVVYGTLAPGRPNHHVVAPLGGTWSEGFVEGDWYTTGWAAAHGYPALRWRSGADEIAAYVLASPRLPDAWPMLDRFEGPEYRRILVPVYRRAPTDPSAAIELIAVANLYEAVVR